MNELFSFHEELTEKEIGQFVNELSEVSLDSFTEAFEMASRKIQEYPHCDLLIYTIATVLNGSLTLSDLNDEERMEYNTAIIEWLERTADSQDERVRNSSVFILATKYVQMEKYEEANALLKKIPDTVIDATIMKTSVLAHQEGTDTAALFLEGKLLQAVINIQSYLYKLIEMEEETGNHDKAEKIAEITDHMISLFGLWNYGNTVPYLLIAGYRKDVEKCIQLIKRLLSESQKPWNMTQSPLYYRYEDTAQGKAFSGLGKNFVRELYSEIENKNAPFVSNIIYIKTNILIPNIVIGMLLSVIINNFNIKKQVFDFSWDLFDFIQNISLDIFLTMALMSIDLYALSSLLGPILIIVFFQVLFVLIYAVFICFRVLGKDYDAAIMISGLIGHTLGATPNALANMSTLTSKYGKSETAFLIVPMVGAFLLDAFSMPCILFFINFLK